MDGAFIGICLSAIIWFFILLCLWILRDANSSHYSVHIALQIQQVLVLHCYLFTHTGVLKLRIHDLYIIYIIGSIQCCLTPQWVYNKGTTPRPFAVWKHHSDPSTMPFSPPGAEGPAQAALPCISVPHPAELCHVIKSSFFCSSCRVLSNDALAFSSPLLPQWNVNL